MTDLDEVLQAPTETEKTDAVARATLPYIGGTFAAAGAIASGVVTYGAATLTPFGMGATIALTSVVALYIFGQIISAAMKSETKEEFHAQIRQDLADDFYLATRAVVLGIGAAIVSEASRHASSYVLANAFISSE